MGQIVSMYTKSKMRLSHEEKHVSLWIVKDVKVYCTIQNMKQKNIESPNLIKSNRSRNTGTYNAFLDFQHEISRNLDVLGKFCLNIRNQQEKSYQNDELFILGFEKKFKKCRPVMMARHVHCGTFCCQDSKRDLSSTC